MLNTLDVLSSRRIEKALFTTFALSLTFFETYVIPRLRKAGCEEVIVLTDTMGYRSSLMERRCRYVGQEFSLIPVTINEGIFHPKVTYLWGKESDLLMVGSGNLTFGGYGKNLEVLDVLESEKHGRAFQDFSEFLNVLTSSVNIEIADGGALEVFSRRAKSQSSISPHPGTTRLLHSVENSIASQLVDLAKETQWDELFVLSPFHSSDGQPIEQIASSLNIDTIHVGVSGKAGATTSFPILKASAWGKKIKVSKPVVENADRSLHAKWLELRGADVWALTGSVNATRQSMGSTKNVEVGVLRVLDEATSASWEPTNPPVYRQDEFAACDNDSLLAIYAEIDDKGYLSGLVLDSASTHVGPWSIELESSEGVEYSGEISLDSSGAFTLKLHSFQFFSGRSALQIRLCRDVLEARGWVSVSGMLKQSSRTRTALSALSRMLASDETATDAAILLDFISASAGQASQFLTQFRESSPKKAPLPEDDVTFSIKELDTWRDTSTEGVFLHLGEAAQKGNSQLTVLAAMGRLLLGKKIQAKESKEHPVSYRRVLVNTDEIETDPTVTEAQDELDVFNRGIRNSIQSVEKEGESYVGLPVMLLVWAHSNIWMQLARFGNVTAALTFANEWMRIAARSKLGANGVKVLEETFAGIAAVLAYKAKEQQGKVSTDFNILLSLATVHEWLTAFYGDEPDRERLRTLATSWLSFGVPAEMVSGNLSDAIEALMESLNTPTVRTSLKTVLEMYQAGEDVHVPTDLFTKDELKLVRRIVASVKSDKLPYKHANLKTYQGCPGCYHVLDQDTVTKLTTRHIAECMNCRSTLVYLGAR